MRTSSSLVDDNARAPRPGLPGASTPSPSASTPSRQIVRDSSAAVGIGARATADPQVVDIWVDRGYQPAQSVAIANVPLRLIFHRRDADHCTERVVFSSPHIERRLAPNGTTAVDLPAQPPGIVRFTCGMGRYRGEIALVERRQALLPRAWALRLLAAGAVVFALLTATGTLPVEAAAGLAVLVVGTSLALPFAARLTANRPSSQS